MSKPKGALRYTDKTTGRPVLDVPKDMLAAAYGLPRTHTSKRAEERWVQGACGAGKGDMQRPRNKKKFDDNYDKIDWSK